MIGIKFMKYLASLMMFLAFSVSVAFAQGALPPDALIKKVTEDILSTVRADKDIQSGDTRKAIELVRAKAVPYFNFKRMTALAMGRDWRQASAEQKAKLTAEFEQLLIRTYSNALTGYKDQTIRYKPFKAREGETDVVVKTEVLQPGGQPIQLDYALEKDSDGWKVFDVVVAGVSLVTNYRDTFNQEVRTNGVDGLIKMLADKNKQLEAGKK